MRVMKVQVLQAHSNCYESNFLKPARVGSVKLQSRLRRGEKNSIVRATVYFCAGLTLTVLVFMIAYILVKGLPFLQRDLFSWQYTSDNCSVMPALVNTLLMTVMALLLAVPLGIGSAIYLVEYARKGNTFVKVVRMTTEL